MHWSAKQLCLNSDWSTIFSGIIEIHDKTLSKKTLQISSTWNTHFSEKIQSLWNEWAIAWRISRPVIHYRSICPTVSNHELSRRYLSKSEFNRQVFEWSKILEQIGFSNKISVIIVTFSKSCRKYQLIA